MMSAAATFDDEVGVGVGVGVPVGVGVGVTLPLFATMIGIETSVGMLPPV
jgi:hypothetical protein